MLVGSLVVLIGLVAIVAGGTGHASQLFAGIFDPGSGGATTDAATSSTSATDTAINTALAGLASASGSSSTSGASSSAPAPGSTTTTPADPYTFTPTLSKL
jgi:hypothetical protein